MTIASDEITALLKAAQVPVTTHLWTAAHSITFTPEVASQVHGDGRALFQVTTINNRPRYWLVRGCSSWTCDDAGAPDGAPEMIDQIEDVCDAIGDEFGSMDSYERDADGDWVDEDGAKLPEGCDAYPVINTDTGRIWHRIDWPALPGVSLERHPFSRETILGEEHAAADVAVV